MKNFSMVQWLDRNSPRKWYSTIFFFGLFGSGPYMLSENTMSFAFSEKECFGLLRFDRQFVSEITKCHSVGVPEKNMCLLFIPVGLYTQILQSLLGGPGFFASPIL